jgi:hypothetical protein
MSAASVAVMSQEEAFALMEALVFYFAADGALTIANMLREASQPEDDPGWHHHTGQPDELTIAVEAAQP